MPDANSVPVEIDLATCTLLGDDQRRDWCADIDGPTRYVCRRLRNHGGRVHVGVNSAGGFHQWSVAVSDDRPDSIPAAIPAPTEPQFGAVYDVGAALALHFPDTHPCGPNRGDPWLILHQDGGIEWAATLREGARFLGFLPGVVGAIPVVDGELDFSALADACEEYVRAYRGSDDPDLPVLVDAINKALGRPVAPVVDGEPVPQPDPDAFGYAGYLLRAPAEPTVDGDLQEHDTERLRATNKSLLAMLERMETQHVTFFGPDGEEFHPDRCRECRVDKARAEAEKFKAAILDIDAHATPIGLLHEDDPEGSPHHYAVTVGVLHRALGKVGHTAAKCDLERERLARELADAHADLDTERLRTEAWAEAAARRETAASRLAIPADAAKQLFRCAFGYDPDPDVPVLERLVALIASWQAPAVGPDSGFEPTLGEVTDQRPAAEQKLEELRAQLCDWAAILARGTGDVPAVDVAWKLRQIADGNNPAPAVGSDTTASDCGCRANPHELWCSQAPTGMTMGALPEFIVRAMDLEGVHESKIVAIVQPDGRYKAVADADVRFARGQFVLALTPAEQSRVSSGGDTDTRAAHCGAMHAEYGECFLDPGVDEHQHGHESEIGRWTVVPAEQEGSTQ